MSNPAVVIFTDGSPNVAGWCRGAGAYKIATELRRAGYETRVLDAFAFWTDEELHALVDRYVGPDTLFVGFSTTLMGPRVTHEDEAHVPEQARARTMGLARSSIFSRSDESMRGLVARIRARNPQARIVVGGPRVEWERAHDFVDYWVVGAGDRTAVALAEHLQHGHPLIVDAGGILNQQQYPYETFSTDGILWSPEDVILPGEALPIEVARGCIFRCGYCRWAMNGKKPGEYVRDEHSLREEIMRSHGAFGSTCLTVCDDLLNDTPEKVRMVHRVSTSLPFTLEYSAYLRLDMLWSHRETAGLLAESGLRVATFGIETLHDEAGRRVGKGLGKARILDTLAFLRECWGNRVMLHSNFIVGLPGEPLESVYETFEWCQTSGLLDGRVFHGLDSARLPGFGIQSSKMDEDPGRYGYTMRGQGYWTRGDGLTVAEARRVAHELNERSTNANPAARSFVGRYVNLGYTFQDLVGRRVTDAVFLADVRRRETLVRSQYKNQVLAGGD